MNKNKLNKLKEKYSDYNKCKNDYIQDKEDYELIINEIFNHNGFKSFDSIKQLKKFLKLLTGNDVEFKKSFSEIDYSIEEFYIEVKTDLGSYSLDNNDLEYMVYDRIQENIFKINNMCFYIQDEDIKDKF